MLERGGHGPIVTPNSSLSAWRMDPVYPTGNMGSREKLGQLGQLAMEPVRAWRYGPMEDHGRGRESVGERDRGKQKPETDPESALSARAILAGRNRAGGGRPFGCDRWGKCWRRGVGVELRRPSETGEDVRVWLALNLVQWWNRRGGRAGWYSVSTRHTRRFGAF